MKRRENIESDGLVKDCVEIKIDGESMICLILRNKNIFVEEKIKKFFNAKSMDTIPPIEIAGKNVFPLEILINHLRPRILAQLAVDGVTYRVNEAINERNNPTERGLSEFDKMILKAINYNPKEKRL